MKSYTVSLSASQEEDERRVGFSADSPASAFDWVDENAPGLDFELFEDGRSLGRVSYASSDAP